MGILEGLDLNRLTYGEDGNIHVDQEVLYIEITATIKSRQPTKLNPDSISLDAWGKAYPHVDNGTPFGLGCTHETVEEAKRDLEEFAKRQADWFKCCGRPVKLKPLKVTCEV